MAAPFPLSCPPQGSNPFLPMSPANNPFFSPPQMAFPPPPSFVPGFHASIRYKYRTFDGGPPSSGAAPSRPSPGPSPFGYYPGGPPPPYPGMGPQICFPNQQPPPMFCQPGPPAWSQPPHPPPGFVYVPPKTPGPPPPPPPPAWNQPPPPGPSFPRQQPFQATGQKKPPRPGDRVQGELPSYPSGKPPVLHSQEMCTFHFVKSNVKPWNNATNSMSEFDARRAATNLTVRELIEIAGARGEYPGDYPWQYIGFTEALDNGNGTWSEGTTFLLGDDPNKLNQTLAEVGWTKDRGEAGQRPPVHLVFAP